MVTIKKPAEVKALRQGGRFLAEILDEILAYAKVGVKTIELDRLAEDLIVKKGGTPAFKNYQGRGEEKPFPTTICASVNNQLVHTPAGNYQLKVGDILTVDIGMKWPAKDPGYYTDMAKTIPIGKISPLARKLLKVTQKSLELGIKQVKSGNHISDISRAVQSYFEAQGFFVVRQLVGHGVGYQVHEEPRVPNYIDKNQKDLELKAGMVLAIEPMVNVGDAAVRSLADGWTVVTADGKLCAHFEHTVAVTKNGTEILTKS